MIGALHCTLKVRDGVEYINIERPDHGIQCFYGVLDTRN